MKTASLRVCASCEWIFKFTEHIACPKCGFGHYGARYVYGRKCYQYAKTQKPWLEKKLSQYRARLVDEIRFRHLLKEEAETFIASPQMKLDRKDSK
jgi:predicted RNA-binding Zn-ribbon protein involved in translation (DUF1610 family)